MRDIELNSKVLLRNGDLTNWQEKSSSVLDKGEPGVEFVKENDKLKTVKLKIGDGSTTYENLPYVGPIRTSELINDGSGLLKEGTPLVGWDELADALTEQDKKINNVEKNIPTKTSQLENDGSGGEYHGPFVDMGEVNDYVSDRAQYSIAEALESDTGYFLIASARAVADYVTTTVGNIETALDEIIALQNTIIEDGE